MRSLFSTLSPATPPAASAVAGLEEFAPLGFEEDEVKAPPMRYGAIPITFHTDKAPSCFTITETKDESGLPHYDIWVLGTIGDSPADSTVSYDIVSILDSAPPGTNVTFKISSPGGVVTIALRICAAMERTRADVTTVAVGRCCSAGLQLWSRGKTRVMQPGAYLMAHGSSHGDSGNSAGIAASAQQTVDYVANVMLRPLVELKVITMEQFIEITERRADIYIDAGTYAKRLEEEASE